MASRDICPEAYPNSNQNVMFSVSLKRHSQFSLPPRWNNPGSVPGNSRMEPFLPHPIDCPIGEHSEPSMSVSVAPGWTKFTWPCRPVTSTHVKEPPSEVRGCFPRGSGRLQDSYPKRVMFHRPSYLSQQTSVVTARPTLGQCCLEPPWKVPECF